MQRTLQWEWKSNPEEPMKPLSNSSNKFRKLWSTIINNPNALVWTIIIWVILFLIFPWLFFFLFVTWIFFSFFNVNLISIIVFIAIIPLIFWINSFLFKSNDIPNLSKYNALACKTEKEDDKALCIEDTISSIKDDWTKKCVEWNIDSKSSLANELKSSKLTDGEIQDIDSLIKECMYYKATVYNGQEKNDYPVFSSFVSSAAWAFVGNYLANQVYRDVPNYNTFYYGNSYRSTFGGYRPSTPDQRAWNMWNIENQYKSDSWNIQSMKSKSAATSNYKLWDSWKSWLNTVYRNSSKSSSWSTFKSSWSSSKSSWSSFGSSKWGSSLG